MQSKAALHPAIFDVRVLAFSLAVVMSACAPASTGDGTATGGHAPGAGSGGAPALGSGGSSSLGTGGASAASGGASAATGGAGSGGASVPGSGGAMVSTGGAGTGSSGSGGATAPGTGGRAATGGAGGSTTTPGSGGASAGSGGQGNVTFQKPAGTIPNAAMPASMTNLPKADWKKGLVSPSFQAGKQINQPSVVNGYLVIAGNEEFWIYDVADPAAPKQIATMSTPGKTGGEAESHTVSFARYGNSLYMVTVGGRGIDTWDITTATAPKHLAQLKVANVNYGDYTEAIWGVAWQGQYIYVGATNNGIKVVDATNPASLSIVKEIPTSQYGGVSAGPLEAIGNVLVVMTPKESGGVATLDISDPVNPVRLASFSTDKAYIGMFYRRYVFFIGVKAWDVLSNPKNIGSGTAPLGKLPTEGSEYMSFSDDYMFLGHVRADIGGNPGASKITVADPKSMKIVNRIWGRMDRNNLNDDQFSIPLGNLLVLGDDQSPYAGWVLAVHSAEPDTKPPVVDTVIPNDGTTVSTKSRIGISFSDNIELATVNAASFIVRPMGGQPLTGKYGLRMGVVNFDPDTDLMPGTTYEVVLPKGGIADLVGNTLAAEWKSTFTTN